MTFWVRILIKIFRANKTFILNNNKTRIMKTIKKFKLLVMLLIAVSIISCEKYQNIEQLVPLTVDQDETLPSISVNGTMLHSEAFGDPANTMLVLIHGGPGSDYRSILKAKEFENDGFYVVFYDQRGTGLSQRHDSNEDVFDVKSYINDLKAVIEYYQSSPSQKVVLVGHSWGAMLATAYVNEYPTLTNGLLLLEPGGFTWEDTEDYIYRWMKLDLTDENVNDMVYIDQFVTGDSHEILDYKAAMVPDMGHLVGNPASTPIWRHGALCNSKTIEFAEENSFDFRTNLDSYNKNVLFLFSENNEAYGINHAKNVATPFINIEIKEVPNCGHEIIEFAWEDFYSIALPFLNQYK